MPGLADYYAENCGRSQGRPVVIVNPGPACTQPGYSEDQYAAQDDSANPQFGLQFGSPYSSYAQTDFSWYVDSSGELHRAPCPSFASALTAATKRNSAKAAREALIKKSLEERIASRRMKVRAGDLVDEGVESVDVDTDEFTQTYGELTDRTEADWRPASTIIIIKFNADVFSP